VALCVGVRFIYDSQAGSIPPISVSVVRADGDPFSQDEIEVLIRLFSQFSSDGNVRQGTPSVITFTPSFMQLEIRRQLHELFVNILMQYFEVVLVLDDPPS
jgi:hypothetical protein